MRTFFRRLATVVAAALAPAAIVTIAPPGVSNAEQCTDGRTWNPQTVMCEPQPPMPAWYHAAPSYAQSWAPPWAPPPPPAPPNAEALGLKAVWDPRLEAWSWIYVR